MKKSKLLSLLLTAALCFQSVVIPVSALETTIPAETTLPAAENAATQAIEPEFGTVCILEGCRTINGMIPLGGSDKRLETAQAAFLYEVNTETVVYSYNPDTKIHPGTLAKLVLGLVVVENADLEDKVVVTEGIQSYVPAGANKVNPHNLKSLEELTVGDLLHAAILINANDAAVALAHHIGGTTDNFKQMMNDRVKRIGCSNTMFGNISGLYTAESYTTARDMARIMRECMKNETLHTVLGTSEYTIPPTNMVTEERKFKTQNYMQDDSTIQDYYDDRVKGGIQSYHEQTGASIVCVATDKTNEEDPIYLEYIAVVLNATRTFAENGWSVLNHGNFNELGTLLKYGFGSFKKNRIIYDGMSLNQFVVNGGECYAVGEAQVDVDSVVPINAQMNNLRMDYKVTDGGLSAPVKKGDLIATLEVIYRNSVMTEVEVFAMADVKEADKTGVTVRSTAVRSDSDDSGLMSVIGTLCVIVLGLAVAYLGFNAYMRSKARARRKRRRAARRRTRE